MNNSVLYYFLLIGFVVFGIVTNSIDFNPVQFHCDNYILNTYLYFILSWGIVMATNSLLSANNVKLNELFSGPYTILLFLASFGLLMGLLFTPAKLFFTKHLLYITLIVLFGVFLYPYYLNNKDLFHHVGITTLIILLLLSLMAFTFPQLIRNSWGLYLFIGLSGLIIARLIEMVMGYKQKSKYSRIMSYVSIVIFSLYIMYDTKKIIVNADNCVNPDYINESINLFLDTLNLFQSNYMLSSR
tara:strand:- start:1016 stop:1744 length:729 start_codon:yes stop_codon:yes gene_type:complete